MGIFARVHELFAILAMRRRLSTRKSHATPGQDNNCREGVWSSLGGHLVAHNEHYKEFAAASPITARDDTARGSCCRSQVVLAG